MTDNRSRFCRHRFRRRRRHYGQAVVGGRLFGRGPRAGRLGRVRPRARVQQGRMAEPLPERRGPPDERSGAPAQHLPPQRQRKSRRPAATAMDAWWAAARSPMAAAAGATCRGSSRKLLPSARLPAPAWRTGRSLTKNWSLITRRPNGRWECPGMRVDSPFVCADVEGLSAAVRCRSRARARCSRSAAAKLGLTAVPGPMAIISEAYHGRSACINCGMCSGFGCQVKARSSSAVAMFPIAEQTGRCEIRPNSYVREISVDNNGRVTGAIYFDAQKREVFQKAKAVVLSANGTESAAVAAAFEVGAVSRWACEFERRRGEVSDVRQQCRRKRDFRAPAQRI